MLDNLVDPPMSPNANTDNAERTPNHTALTAFFESVKSRTSDLVHLRLLKAAAKEDPAPALEKELEKIVQEILDEA
jgi:hypothetical protein